MYEPRLTRTQTTGLAVVTRLSEDPTVSVLVLEAGFANLNEDSLSAFSHSHSLHPLLTLLSHVRDVWEELFQSRFRVGLHDRAFV